MDWFFSVDLLMQRQGIWETETLLAALQSHHSQYKRRINLLHILLRDPDGQGQMVVFSVRMLLE